MQSMEIQQTSTPELAPKKNLRKFWVRIKNIIRKLIVLFLIISVSWVVIDRFTPVWITPLMLIRSVQSLTNGEMPKNSKRWVPIKQISPNMVQAVIASEDNLFMTHHGFSFEDMWKAFRHNQKGKRIHGGSTISQQTAKNVFLFPARSYIRKAVEAYFTVLIELIWGKKRIMEVYLNTIEMGKGIYGVEAASLEFYGIHASALSASQAAGIAACLPNPRRYKPNGSSSYIRNRKAHIINLMYKIQQVDFQK